MKYNAFISYSHASDDALAPALQSALHAFARPWTRMRAIHVFRDQTSLAASPELWPAIENALKESTHLLLLASPAAANSRWVAREIEWWFANRSPSTMLVLLTDGELAWDESAGDFDWSRTTSLPREVISGRLHGEPLWVDLRWARNSDALSLRNARFRSAVLDIAAPLHGKDKDALDGDDVRAFTRLQRVRRAAIAGLATLTLAAVVAATVAVRQRDEAIKQNAIAQAGRLAAQADLLRERGGRTDASVLLAAQALNALGSVGAQSFEVDLSLRRALAGMPSELAELDVTADAVRISPSGEFMVLESTGGQVAVLALPGGERRSCDRTEIESKGPTPSEHSTAVRLVTAASTNGDWCVMQQFDSGFRTTLSLWSARPLTRVDEWRLSSKAGHLHPSISDDGDVLATTDRAQTGEAAKSTLRLWSRSRHVELLHSEGEEFRGFSPDRRHFATTKGLWALPDSGSSAATRIIQWRSEPWHLAFGRTGAFVVTRASHDGPAELWDVGARRVLRSFTPPTGEILALREDGRFIVVQARDSALLVDTDAGDVHEGMPGEAKAAAFGTRDPVLLIREFDRIGLSHVRVLALPSAGAALASTELPIGSRAWSIALVDNHLDALVSSDFAFQIIRWNLESTGWKAVLTLPAPTTLDFSRDGRYFAAAFGDSVVVARVDGSGTPRVKRAGQPVLKLALGADGEYLVVLTGDRSGGRKSLTVDALGEGKHWNTEIETMPSDIMVSRDGSSVVALVVDDTITSRAGPMHTLVRMQSTNPRQNTRVDIGRSLEPLRSVCMVSDDAMFIRAGGVRHQFGSDSEQLRIRDDDFSECAPVSTSPLRSTVNGSELIVSDSRTGQQLVRLDQMSKITESSVSVDGKRVATVDERGAVHVFALDAKSLVAQACQRKPRPLSEDEWTRYLGSATRVDACGRARVVPATTERSSSRP